MAERASIRYAGDLLTLSEVQARVLARMLQRLPASLWDIDPASDTLQRDFYRALALQAALWLENRSIAHHMVLLLEAEGVDLDALLQDYGLKRYMQRPDAYARQIGMQLLWTPKGMLYSLSVLADLLFDLPHLTLRTGRGEQHVLVVDNHPITTPYTYWGLLSDEGIWYAVTVHSEVPTISQGPPPGLNVAPGPHTLHWFTVQDETSANWYVTITADTLSISTTPPAWGYGTASPFQVLDGQGNLWGLQVNSVGKHLVSTVVSTGNAPQTVLTLGHAYEALRLVDNAATTWWLSIQATTGMLTTTQPTGTIDVTPTGGPFRWLRLRDVAGSYWYASPTTEGPLIFWDISATPPAGLGTALPQALGDATGVQWHFGAGRGGTFVFSDAPHANYGGMATALTLRDASGNAWFWRVSNGLLESSAWLWPDTMPQSPWGDLGWIQLANTAGAVRAVFPSLTGVPTAAAGPPFSSVWGWTTPITLIDTDGVHWHLVVSGGDVVSVAQEGTDDVPALPNPLNLRDAVEAFAHIQPAGNLVTVYMT